MSEEVLNHFLKKDIKPIIIDGDFDGTVLRSVVSLARVLSGMPRKGDEWFDNLLVFPPCLTIGEIRHRARFIFEVSTRLR